MLQNVEICRRILPALDVLITNFRQRRVGEERTVLGGGLGPHSPQMSNGTVGVNMPLRSHE